MTLAPAVPAYPAPAPSESAYVTAETDPCSLSHQDPKVLLHVFHPLRCRNEITELIQKNIPKACQDNLTRMYRISMNTTLEK